ncbi:ATP-binding protein [Aminobacterium sp. MB27-C1]|uniref:ATP-binding protein n=1 Tax=Aminobacterium sp. MB27-C1 TaxID=3070661 RepID=UPI0027DBD4F1|nr:ATP-binding protein [Aminobacterium sp. MB27-C1]WMI72161.1 ATP-binding protein [Aminobacterium sp. MB27-C1]
MTSPISNISMRTVGTVESVSSDEIKVLLDIDAPRNIALNTGVPISFPKINSFLLLPNEVGAVVGSVIWVGVERSAYPKRQGLKDFGLIDLPFPLRKMILTPIGTLTSKEGQWKLERGVQSFPSVGDPVILPTQEQSIAIVTNYEKNSRLKIGTCPTAHNALIQVDPDKLFGRHLAVLGNTGSGKSCTLAVLIRSSVEAAQSNLKQEESDPKRDEQKNTNARFIILDPNGEYSNCFQDLGSGCRVFKVPPFEYKSAEEFVLPAWMWNSSEWAAVAQAAPKAQKPLLQTALRDLRSGYSQELNLRTRIQTRCNLVLKWLLGFEGKGATGFPENKDCGTMLHAFQEDINIYKSDLAAGDVLIKPMSDLGKELDKIYKENFIDNKKYYGDFSDSSLSKIIKLIKEVLAQYPQKKQYISANEDMPIRFDASNLANYLEVLASQQSGNSSQYIPMMVMRIKTMLSDSRMKDVVNPNDPPSLQEWLEKYIGSNQGENGPVAVIDLSLVPYEILHLVIAITSRLIIEALQRYKKLYKENLPTVLVLEEAHTFVAKKMPHGDEIPTPADMCRCIFERIAREGRKFGLGLVLSSQRPSELSETVLSQCNTFLLHRITNDRDQELVSRLVPDTTRGLLKELPSLPKRHCILLGVTSKIPVLVEVKDLKKEQQPESEDPDFWDVWTFQKERKVDWSKIANIWIGTSPEDTSDFASQEEAQ